MTQIGLERQIAAALEFAIRSDRLDVAEHLIDALETLRSSHWAPHLLEPICRSQIARVHRKYRPFDVNLLAITLVAFVALAIGV